MARIRWGILSTADIGRKKVIPAMQNSTITQIMGIASRDSQKAEKAAQELNIPRAFGSYKDLLASPEIDAVYIPLPNHLHVEWTIKALQAGKHVLCEKPIAMNAAEAQTLLQTAQQYPHLKVMEAFMYRFHPQWIQTLEWVRSGTIGDLTTIHTLFSYFKDDPDNIRNKPETGGGGLMDIGCYPISLSRFLFESEPLRISGWMQYDSLLKVDRLTSAIMEFEDGTSTFTVSTQMAPYQRVWVFGRTGHVEIEVPFNASGDNPMNLLLEQNGKTHTIAIPAANQYQLQGDAFSNAILENTPVPTPLQDAVNNMRVLDAVRSSHDNDEWQILKAEN